MDTIDKPVLQILDDYKAAVFAKSVDAFVTLYDPNVLVFDMWSAWSYHGIAAWRGMVEGWFGSLGAERVIVEFSDAQTIVTGELAVIHAFVAYQAIDADGVKLRSMDNRITMTLRRNGTGWKIVHQHTSSPIDGGTAQVIFKRG